MKNYTQFISVMDHKSRDLLLNIPCHHIIHQIKNRELKQLLKKLHEINIFNIFVLGTTDTINMIIQEAENTDYKKRGEKGMFGRKWAWFLTTMVCFLFRIILDVFNFGSR